jgi:hypothetical protein
MRHTSYLRIAGMQWVHTLSGASHCFLEQETLHSLLSTNWFQEQIHECLNVVIIYVKQLENRPGWGLVVYEFKVGPVLGLVECEFKEGRFGFWWSMIIQRRSVWFPVEYDNSKKAGLGSGRVWIQRRPVWGLVEYYNHKFSETENHKENASLTIFDHPSLLPVYRYKILFTSKTT